MTFAIIIAILVFIAYQLYQLNQGKKYEVATKATERSEGKLRELFPHLYPNASEKAKDELGIFLEQSSDYLADYLYLERFKQMNDAVEAETNLEKKEKMRTSKEAATKDMGQYEAYLRKATDKRNATRHEVDFVIWSYLNYANKIFSGQSFFPGIETALNQAMGLTNKTEKTRSFHGIENMDTFMLLNGFKSLLSLGDEN